MSESNMTVTAQWQAHDLEAWSAAFDRWQEHVVYSGADDCMFKGWDLRQPDSSPTFINRQANTLCSHATCLPALPNYCCRHINTAPHPCTSSLKLSLPNAAREI